MSGSGLQFYGLGSGHLTWGQLMALPRGPAGAVALGPVLDAANIDRTATHGTVTSRGGAYTASIPLETLRSGGRLAVALDGAPIPGDQGGALRLTVVDGDTLCWNVKDVGSIRFTTGPEPDSVPENPQH